MKLMGSHAHETARMIVEELELPMTIDEFLVESKQLMEAIFPDTKVLPGTGNIN